MKFEWQNYTLEDVSRIYSGGTPSTKNKEYWDGDINWLSSGETGNRYIYSTDRHITKAGVENSSTRLAKVNSTVVASAGQGYTRGQASFLKIDTYVNQSVIVFEPKIEIINPLYLFYNLSNRYDELRLLSDGTSTRGGLSGWIVKRMIICLPPLYIQNRIVDILYSLDRKIETNKRINDNLFQQARVLYKKWFRKTKDRVLSLSQIADINPETYSPSYNWDFVNYLDTSSITAGVITEIQRICPSEERLPSRARRILRRNDIVFSTVRPNQLHYGIIANPRENMLGSTGFAVVRSRLDNIPNEIIYLALTEPSFVEQMQQLAEQSVSTFPSIRPTDLDACVIPVPGEEDVALFEGIRTFFSVIAENDEENSRLTSLRDTLLPRLMSGEIDVSNVAI